MRSIGALLDGSRGQLAPVELYYLLGHVIGRSKEFVLSHPEYKVNLRSLMRWKRAKRLRLRGVPAAYLTGEREFYGLLFRVNRHTLIPRPETELIVDEVIRRRPGSMLDMGTGSGCVALAVAHSLPECRITAIDISRRALSVARYNSRALGERENVCFIRSNYFSNLSPSRYDVIASNPPYVREDDVERLAPEVAEYEPSRALYGGEDGLHAFRTILGAAKHFLSSEGVLILEISPDNSREVITMADQNGYRVEKMEQDLSGNDRMVVLVPL
jgi:release factor glutamine methyltransferase